MIEPFRPADIKPVYPAVIDIETASDGRVLAIEYGYQNEYGTRIYHTFDEWGEFLVFIRGLVNKYKSNREQLHKITRIWAHNGANFDYLSLVEYIRDNNLAKDVQYIINGSQGIGVIIKLRSKETIRLFDSNRLLPGSLDKLCKEFNTTTKKNEIPKQYKSKMENLLRDNKEMFYDYLHNDVASLQEVIYKFWCMIYEIDGSIGYLPMTLPALAMRLFRKGLDDNTYITVPWNNDVKSFCRRGYTGGRVEVAKSGEIDNVKIYDVNSMYPAVMRDNDYPASARAAWVYEYMPDMLGFYEIVYEQLNTEIPPILRDEATNELMYKGSGVYSTAEIELFVEYGGTFTIVQGLVFQRKAKLFSNFVDKYYKLRIEAQSNGNTALSFVCKILLNSLYGKFGQSGVKQQIEQVNKSRIKEIIDNGGNVHILSENYMVCQEGAVVEHEFVAIAAYVTSYARVLLYRIIVSCGNDYIYCDTDSVHCTNISFDTSTDLGKLKLEKEDTVIYLGKKLYFPKSGEPKAKGIGRAIKTGKIQYTDFQRLLDAKESLIVEFDVFPTVKEVMSEARVSCVMFTRTRTIKRLK